MELVILIGLQASGKSAFRRAHFAETHLCISKDDFPKTKNRNKRQRRMLEEAFKQGLSVVVDNTNPSIAERAELITLARAYQAKITGYYFRWRQSDAARCALNGWCYWTLRKAGKSVKDATAMLENKSPAYKNELLFQHGINFNDLPQWQRRGLGVYWEKYEKEGYDPIKKERVKVLRRHIKVDLELLIKEDYGRFIREIIREG